MKKRLGLIKFKLFLKISLLGTLFASCVHERLHPSDRIPTDEKNYLALSAIENNSKLSESQKSSKIKGYFCNGNKAKRNLSVKIFDRFVPPKNMPLDEVVKLKEDRFNNTRRIAENIFNAKGYVDSGISFDDEQDFIYGSADRGLTFYTNNSGNKLLETTNYEPGGYIDVVYSSKDKKFYKTSIERGSSQAGYTTIPSDTFEDREDFFLELKKEYLYEPFLFVSHFTFMNVKFLDENCALGHPSWERECKASGALKWRVKFYNKYVEKFTTFKESKSEKNTLSITATLDLNPFCKNAVAVADLLSQ